MIHNSSIYITVTRFVGMMCSYIHKFVVFISLFKPSPFAKVVKRSDCREYQHEMFLCGSKYCHTIDHVQCANRDAQPF